MEPAAKFRSRNRTRQACMSLSSLSSLPARDERAAFAKKFDRAAEGVLVEKQETIVYANARYAKYLGYPSATHLIGSHVSAVIAPADEKRMLNYGRRRIRGQHAPDVYEFYARQKDGGSIQMAARVSSTPELGLITTVVRYSSAAIATVKALFRDEEGFEHFYAEHSGLIYAVLLRMLRDDHDAQDVLQESFMQAWRQRNRYEPDRGSPGAWIVTIARSRALDHIRKVRAMPSTGSQLYLSDPLAQSELTSRLERSRIREMLAFMPETQRTTIELAYFDGYTQTEIASRLGIPLGTVKSRIMLGMRRLREHVNAPQEI